MDPTPSRIAVIGGTGLYDMPGLTEVKWQTVSTPFGEPSGPITLGRLGSQNVAFLPRHGSQHQLLPSEINFRANIWALKSVGVTQILSVSAVGSLVLEVEPASLAIPSQYIDFTKGKRQHTFFGEGLVAHISTAHPSCASLSQAVVQAAKEKTTRIHAGKLTYVCVEGPRLGTQAESAFLKNAGGHIVGMTNIPEAFLAREAQICYCTIAVVTDYDCWLDDPSQHASVDQVIALYKKNLNRVQAILEDVLSHPVEGKNCTCRSALQFAVMTPDSVITPAKRELLNLLRK